MDNIKAHWKENATFTQIFEKALSSTQPKDTWGQESFHLSDASSCLRKIYYRMIGTPREHVFDMNLAIGHAVHGTLQYNMVKNLGWCTDEDIEVPISIPELNLKGSVDAVVSTEQYRSSCKALGISPLDIPGSHFILDFKTKKDEAKVSRVYNQGKTTQHTFPGSILQYPDQGYFLQLQAYMGLLGECYPERYPDIQYGLLLYVCKNDGRFFSVGLNRLPGAAAFVKERAQLIKTAIENKQPPPQEYGPLEGNCRGWLCDGSYKYSCDFYKTCWHRTPTE